jgi:hypothetical protein
MDREYDKLQKIADSIRRHLNEMNRLFSDQSFRKEHYHAYADPEDEDFYEAQEITKQLQKQFQYYAERVFCAGKVFFELQGMDKHREEFIKEIKPVIKDPKKLLKGSYSEDIGEEWSETVYEFWKYFYPFAEFIREEQIDDYHTKTGLKYLETILESTANILHEMKITPSKESDVYDTVGIVVRSIFPNNKLPTEAFVKPAGCYKPDILLPQLKTAIEYKYAATEKEVNRTMDQILADVKGYSNNSQYKHFYAVFYVKAGAVSQKRFDVLWQSKDFPANWHPVMSEGLLSGKKKTGIKKGRTPIKKQADKRKAK